MDIDPDELKKLVGSMETTGDDDDDDDDGSFTTDRGTPSALSPKSVSIASTPAGSNQPSPNRPRERKAFDP
jgi:hypothetical protein